MKRLMPAVCLAVSFLLSGAAHADELGSERLVEDYVAAINAKDVGKLKGLIHPKYLDCINDGNRDYYDDYFSREMRRHIPEGYSFSELNPVGEDEPLLMEGRFSYPVRPTHWVQIDFGEGPYGSVTVVRQIVKSGQRLYVVVPCPSRLVVERFRETQIARGRQRVRAMALYKELQEPLLSELRQLLKRGRKVEAWKRYSAETGESLSTAKAVLSLVETEKER